jgi:hypothetical protein
VKVPVTLPCAGQAQVILSASGARGALGVSAAGAAGVGAGALFAGAAGAEAYPLDGCSPGGGGKGVGSADLASGGFTGVEGDVLGLDAGAAAPPAGADSFSTWPTAR